jgi:hypothetical protein
LVLTVLGGSIASHGQRKPCETVCTSNTPPYQQEGKLSFYPLSLVAIFRWTIPLAAWLVPVFLLRFVRTQPLLRRILLVLLATVLVLVFALQGVMPIPGALYYLVVFGSGAILTLPYLIDRVIAPTGCVTRLQQAYCVVRNGFTSNLDHNTCLLTMR